MTRWVERYGGKVLGEVSCLDRVVITGTLPDICHAQAMERHLRVRKVRLFDYPRWAEPLREEIRLNAESLAREAGLEIDFIRRKNFRKEERVKQILDERGDHPGLVHVFSAMEPCLSFRPWHEKKTGQTTLRPRDAKCLHYYFYFVDAELGLCYLRVPTWAPFRLQLYFNRHNRLACRLRAAGIGFEMGDNAFVAIEDFDRAQELAHDAGVEALHRLLDRLARLYCPVVERFTSGYHWSLMQVEYATDLVWKRREDLAPVYDALVRDAVHAVRSDEVASFLGRKVHPLYTGEVGTDFHTRIEGTRIKHHMGKASIKMYDKLGRVLRIETTVNDVSFFQHHRRVEHKDGTWTMKLAPVKKTIYSLPALCELLRPPTGATWSFSPASTIPPAACVTWIAWAAASTTAGAPTADSTSSTATTSKLLETLLRGEYTLRGFQNRHLQATPRQELRPDLSPAPAAAHLWPHQEGPRHLSLSPHSARPTNPRPRPQAASLLSRPASPPGGNG